MAFCSAFLRRYFRWFPSKCCSRYCLSYLLSPETKPVRLLLMQCSIFCRKIQRIIYLSLFYVAEHILALYFFTFIYRFIVPLFCLHLASRLRFSLISRFKCVGQHLSEYLGSVSGLFNIVPVVAYLKQHVVRR